MYNIFSGRNFWFSVEGTECCSFVSALVFYSSSILVIDMGYRMTLYIFSLISRLYVMTLECVKQNLIFFEVMWTISWKCICICTCRNSLFGDTSVQLLVPVLVYRKSLFSEHSKCNFDLKKWMKLRFFSLEKKIYILSCF